MIILGLPAYNEEVALPKLFEKIRPLKDSFGENLKVTVVNDGSNDGTGKILEEYAEKHDYMNYIDHPKNLGLGSAMSTLFDYVIENYGNKDILVTMDADNTHNPCIIKDMCDKLQKEKLDVVIASRFAAGGEENGVSPVRKIFSRGARAFFKVFFPIRNINDYSSGFRAYDIGYLKSVSKLYAGRIITTDGFDCMAEILARFGKVGVNAAEYPLKLEYNLKEGKSKIKVVKTIKGYFTLLARVHKPDMKKVSV